MVMKDTYSVGINETWDQEFSFLQVQPLEFSTVGGLSQEILFGDGRTVQWCDLVDGLDQTVVADVNECVGKTFIVKLVDGGDERTGDEERHLGTRVVSVGRG